MVIFFFASAGASAAYLTVSEIFPMETRALAIAFFYAVGTGLGGIIGPVLFGHLIATKRQGDTTIGYLIGAALMVAAGVVEIFLGVDAERKSLEEVATPLSAEGGTDGQSPNSRNGTSPTAPSGPPASQRSPYPVPRGRFGATWAPRPQMSSYPRSNPYLAGEVDAIVAALGDGRSHSATELSRAVGARYWGPGRFHAAMRSGLASGRVRRAGHQLYTAGERSSTV